MTERDNNAVDLAKRIETWIDTLDPDVAQAVWYLINKGKMDELLDIHTQWIVDEMKNRKNGPG
jgi:hypothetical protein